MYIPRNVVRLHRGTGKQMNTVGVLPLEGMQIRHDQKIGRALWEWPALLNEYSPSKSSYANRHSQIMPERSHPKPSEERDNTESQASGSVAHGRAFSPAHYRSCPITVELSAHPASRLFRGHCLDSSADVPELGAGENGYEGVCVLGEQWLLHTEWGPEKQGCLSVRAGQKSATHTRRRQRWDKNKSRTVATAAADVPTSPCPPTVWLFVQKFQRKGKRVYAAAAAATKASLKNWPHSKVTSSWTQ